MDYVVDQNWLGNTTTPNLSCLTKDPNNRFIIPDSGLTEMFKNSNWREITLQNLEILSKNPDKTFITMDLKEAFDFEIKNKRAIKKEELIDSKFSCFVRKYMMHADQLTELEKIISIEKTISKTKILESESHKAKIKKMTKKIQKDCTPDEIKVIMGNDFKEKSNLIADFIRKNFTSISSENPQLFIEPSIVSKTLYARIFISFCFIKDGFPEKRLAKKFTNDLLDTEYAILGSCFDQVLSEDKFVRDLYFHLRNYECSQKNQDI